MFAPLRLIVLAAGFSSCLSFFPTQDARAAVLHTEDALVGEVRVKIGGKVTTCGGTLVGASIVLTAAHCVQFAGQKNPVAPSSVTFHFRGHDGSAQVMQAGDIATHPDFFFVGTPGRSEISLDAALVWLKGYARGPFERVAPADRGHAFLALRPASPGAPFKAEPCRSSYEEDRIIVLSCARDFGASGSPVFDLIQGEQRIVAIVSAKGERDGAAITFAVSLAGLLEELTYAVRDRGMTAPTDRGRISGFAD